MFRKIFKAIKWIVISLFVISIVGIVLNQKEENKNTPEYAAKALSYAIADLEIKDIENYVSKDIHAYLMKYHDKLTNPKTKQQMIWLKQLNC